MQMCKRKDKIIFILIILMSVTIISFKFFIRNSQPFGVTILRVSSNSMMPKFKKGDIITYKIKENEKEYCVTHRIIKKDENEFITKGDANNREDSYKVYENEIKGKVVFP